MYVTCIMYSTWKLTELKQELKRRGASSSGKKADLVERLEAYDRNFNFGRSDYQEEEPAKQDEQMVLPDANCYKDINSNTRLPPLKKYQIQQYFDGLNQVFVKGKSLYENRYLIILRAATVQDFTYIRGICKAEMKRTQYEVNVKLHKNGAPEEAQCECTAGSGIYAQCKHIATVLIGIAHMLQDKTVLLEETCTQKLQTFHQPKKRYSSTPLKAEKLPYKRIKENINFHPYSGQTNREKYNERLRNLILNFTNDTMPLKQLYRPANPYGIEWDHGHYGYSSKYAILESLLLKNVSLEKIKKVEKETRNQAESEMWKIYRKNRLTASNFHAICHLRVETMSSFAEALLSRRSLQTRAVSHGKVNEKVALKQYCEKYEVDVKECGLFIHKEKPYLGASPDALLGRETVIEIKCPYSTRYCSISPTTVPYINLENGELHLKKTSPYYFQVQDQLFCTNRKYCNLVIYTYQDLKVVYITRDDAFIKEMVDKLDLFYKNYFEEAVLDKYLYKNYAKIIKQ